MSSQTAGSRELEALSQSRSFVVVHALGMCVECDDQPACVTCAQCQDDYCEYCFAGLHKKGQRRTHTATRIEPGTNANITKIVPADSTAAAMTASDATANATAASASANKLVIDAPVVPLTMTDSDTTADADAAAAASNAVGSDEDSARESARLGLAALEQFDNFQDRMKYTPVRLDESERCLLRILQDALETSEYTSNVDCVHQGYGARSEAMRTELAAVYSLLLGMSAAHDVKAVKRMATATNAAATTANTQSFFSFSRNSSANSQSASAGFAPHAAFFQTVFEIGRRHKIRNPEKLRGIYGKLMFVLMDAQSPPMRDAFGFSPLAPIKTARSVLAPYSAEALLRDPDLPLASAPLTARRSVSPAAAAAAVTVRAQALERLKARWTAAGDTGDPGFGLPAAEAAAARAQSAVAAAAAGGQAAATATALKRAAALAAMPFYESKASTEAARAGRFTLPSACKSADPKFYEVDDDGTVRVKAFGPTPVLPLDVLMSVIHAASDATAYLQQAIAPIDATIRFLEPFGTANPPRSLEIESGSMGARLNHNHATQFMYVRQSLALWRLIMLNMMKLWSVADADMLSESNPHRLQNTGQGLNRMQNAPLVGRAMSEIMTQAYAQFNNRWVGSSAVHLGDINVPNAFVFIDKYTQVERILAPFVATVQRLDQAIASFNAAKAERDFLNAQSNPNNAVQAAAAADANSDVSCAADTVGVSDEDINKFFAEADRQALALADSGDSDDDDSGNMSVSGSSKHKRAKKARQTAAAAAVDPEVANALRTDALYGIHPVAVADSVRGDAAAAALAERANRGDTAAAGAGIAAGTLSEVQPSSKNSIYPCPAVYTPQHSRRVLAGWIRAFYGNNKSVRALTEYIMSDFFKHAFDGSGAEDYSSAGSCIDGRLTSAWNWCSKLSKKSYYVLFLLTGFVGFEGAWSD